MASIFLAKNTFIDWAQNQKKERRKPFVELPPELLNCFERFQISKLRERENCNNAEPEEEEEDDGITITLHQYPLWAVRDWFYIYQQWVNIALNYTAYYSANYWQNMPSLQEKFEKKVSSVSQIVFREICDGMSGFLHYLFQNDRSIQQKENVHFDPSGLIQSYINYLCITFPIV